MSEIEIEEADVPDNAAPFTLKEIVEGQKEGLFDPSRGDLIFEWADPDTGSILGRAWAWKNGRGIERTFDLRHVLARALWIARPERLH